MPERFPNELDNLKRLFEEGKSTLEVKNYLVNKYNCKGSATAKIIKAARKSLGIYQKEDKNGKANN